LVVTTCKGTWSSEAALVFLFLLPSLFYVINNITKSAAIDILMFLNCNHTHNVKVLEVYATA
jgi:hypothetical protein